jgi:hypothetical protein
MNTPPKLERTVEARLARYVLNELRPTSLRQAVPVGAPLRMIQERGLRAHFHRASRWTFSAVLVAACAGRSLEYDGNGTPKGETTGGAANVSKGGSGGTGGHGGSAVAGRSSFGGGPIGPGIDGGGGGTTSFPTAGVSGGGHAGVAGHVVTPAGGTGGVGGRAGSGGVSGTSSGDGGDSGTGNAFPCFEARAWSSNAIACADGFIHRAHAGACTLPNRDSGEGGGAGDGGGFGGAVGVSLPSGCSTDADCGATSYCLKEGKVPGGPVNVCVNACQTDADCGAEALCLCGEHQKASGVMSELGECVYDSCRVDSDCSPGFLCQADPKRLERGFNCQTPFDQCGGNDCDPSYFFCAFQDETYVCTL